eukprot:CAMPEP_0179331570 /NCGR_PEP_ID=MMETSP0797-20121207/64262_1 /TAXON_ID=47934 /ORGANISM="Dinophysis acuminata, Strain DAEP01" /LENGTH=95 /DNA_ID=CAMNT_0021044363 /DNA_START=21 /DNA_END=305 /DNA_ORIENTATION=+
MVMDSLAASAKRHWLFKSVSFEPACLSPASAATSSAVPADLTMTSSGASSSSSIQSGSFQPRASIPKRHWLFELPRLSEARDQPAWGAGDGKCPR